MKRRNISLLSVAALAAAMFLGACCKSGKPSATAPEAVAHPLPDTLRVATLYSPTSYFMYRDEEMGYDYSLISQFAQDKGIAIALTVAPSLQAMIELLDSGRVDILAYEIPVTAEFRKKVIACGPEVLTHQVLVQPRQKGDSLITDETQLIGRDVYVEADSKYDFRMQNLNEELGGGVNIHKIDRDTLVAEDLIEMVSTGEIPLTVVDSDIARLNKTYYPDLDVSLALSFDQKSSWGVGLDKEWLADSIDTWLASETPSRRNIDLLKRYFELAKNGAPQKITIDFSKGRISPYDEMFRRHAKANGLDWRILAAQGYCESQFRNDVVSWAGARGLMQLMPTAARAYGLTEATITDPDASIGAAARIMRDLDRTLAKKVTDPKERRKFAIAAYNSGMAHILDAIALAAKYGKDPQIWEGNVESALLMKANPEYYTDPVCKYGYFRGRQTVDYVQKVMAFYNRASAKIKE